MWASPSTWPLGCLLLLCVVMWIYWIWHWMLWYVVFCVRLYMYVDIIDNMWKRLQYTCIMLHRHYRKRALLTQVLKQLVIYHWLIFTYIMQSKSCMLVSAVWWHKNNCWPQWQPFRSQLGRWNMVILGYCFIRLSIFFQWTSTVVCLSEKYTLWTIKKGGSTFIIITLDNRDVF